MASKLNLTLSDELRAFIDANCGDGTPYATPGEFVCELIHQRKRQIAASRVREAILEGYQDAIEGRTVTFAGD